MKRVNYRGYTISQASNNHIMITTEGVMVFHASTSKKMSTNELKEQIDWFINIFLEPVNQQMKEIGDGK